jgi:hypothetical protein
MRERKEYHPPTRYRAAAESRSLRRIFTLDPDVRVNRLADGPALDVIP